MRRCVTYTGTSAAKWHRAGARCYVSSKKNHVRLKLPAATTAKKESAQLNSSPADASHESDHAIPAQELSTSTEDYNDLFSQPLEPTAFPDAMDERFTTPPIKKTPIPRRNLPLSPLMDPAFHAARSKHKAPKAPPTKAPTGSFSSRLARNPYALALASPIRQCRITRALLPTFFLQDFNLMKHPVTGEAWYMPVSLAKRRPVTAIEKKKPPKQQILETLAVGDLAAGVKANKAMDPWAKKVDVEGKKIGSNTYTMSSMLLIDQLQRTKKFSPVMFINQRIHRLPLAAEVARNANWRKDMGTFMRDLHRRRISESLIYIMTRKRGYLLNCPDWEDAKSREQIGAYLWIGDYSDASEPPAQWATVDMPFGPQANGEFKKIPVYNLPALLGAEALEALQDNEHGKVMQSGIVAVKDRRVTLELRLKLWKFQGFMATAEQEMEVVYDDDLYDDDEDGDEDDEKDDLEVVGEGAFLRSWGRT